jgi:DNA-binding FadR family transcriptional regulator
LSGSSIQRPIIPETNERTIAEHRAIADGVASGDKDAAGEAMRAHLVAAGQRLRTLLPARETRG